MTEQNKKTIRRWGAIISHNNNTIAIKLDGNDEIVLSSSEAYKLFQLLAMALPELNEIENDFGEVISMEWFLNKYNLK